jgi:multidrug resistance efflux pump
VKGPEARDTTATRNGDAQSLHTGGAGTNGAANTNGIATNGIAIDHDDVGTSAPPNDSINGTNTPDDPPPPTDEAPRRPPKKKSKRPLFTILAIVVLAALIGGALYWQNAAKYVTTDNAQVDGDKIDINAPDTGTIVDWEISQGSTVTRNQLVGRIKIQGTGPQRPIRSPGDGTVAVNNVVNGTYVTAGSGQPLATAYNLSSIYITARVDETDVSDVHVGAPVDFTVDAIPGVTMTGVVQEVQGSSAGTFSLFPQSNSTGNFQKVTQVIPIKITPLGTGGATLAPGMNVEVHIHKQQ